MLNNWIQLSTRECAGDSSVHFVEVERSRSPAFLASPTSSTWLRTTVESGRAPTPDRPGLRFLMISTPAPSELLQSLPPIPTSSTWAAAQGYDAPTFLSVTASTSRSMAGGVGS